MTPMVTVASAPGGQARRISRDVSLWWSGREAPTDLAGTDHQQETVSAVMRRRPPAVSMALPSGIVRKAGDTGGGRHQSAEAAGAHFVASSGRTVWLR